MFIVFFTNFFLNALSMQEFYIDRKGSSMFIYLVLSSGGLSLYNMQDKLKPLEKNFMRQTVIIFALNTSFVWSGVFSWFGFRDYFFFAQIGSNMIQKAASLEHILVF